MEHLDHLNEFFMNEINIRNKEKIELNDKNTQRTYFMYFFTLLFIILFTCKISGII